MNINSFPSKEIRIPEGLHQLIYQQSFFISKAQVMKQLRENAITDTELVASKGRFGLFSQPPPIAVGDNSLFPAKHANKGEDGKPKTKPRNMLAGTNRSGIGRKSYLHVPESIYQKDPYKDPFKIELEYERKIRGKSANHEADFVPASGPKSITNSPYPHHEEKESRIIKAQRDENGRVKTQPSNVITNPPSRIEVRLFKHVEHMRDEYSRPKEIQKQEKEIWKSKVTGETMFRSMSHGNSLFTRERAIYGIDDQAKMLLSQKKPFRFGPYKRTTHETKFKLARRGHGDPIGRYPESVETRGRIKTESSVLKRLDTQKSETQRDLWKPTSGSLSRPTPSISLLVKNIRRRL